MCLPYLFSYGLSSPSGGPRCCCDSCAKQACRATAAYAAFASTATTAVAAASAAAAAAELLLCCCCCHIRVPLLRVPKKSMMLCFAMPTDVSFFRYEISIFCDLMEFRRFAHRQHSQSDAGMNLAFFKFDRVNG